MPSKTYLRSQARARRHISRLVAESQLSHNEWEKQFWERIRAESAAKKLEREQQESAEKTA